MSQDTSSQKAQLNSQNQLQQQQQAAQNQLLQQNNKALSPYLSGNMGFTPQQMAALNSSALDQNAQRFNQATQQTNAMLAARGENGMTPGSGVQATGYGNLQSAKAGDLADSLRTVTLNNAQQANANQFNAASVLSGNAQTYGQNVGTYGSGANNSLNALTSAQANTWQSQFGKSLGGALGAAGAAFGGGAANAGVGALGTAVSNIGSGNFGW